MIEIPSLRPETRYGISPADQLLINRHYIVGYSFLFRQAKWTLELIDPDNDVEVDRKDHFREDLRVPEAFRAAKVDYEGSGFHRGHLVPSADRLADRIENSETFLLSNMSPQTPSFNSGIWKKHEGAVRHLAAMFAEVYVICGPLFDVGQPIEVIGDDPAIDDDVVIPVPHAYFKSVLAENDKGKLSLWSFILPNKGSQKPLDAFLVKTTEIERRAGLQLWDRLRGQKADKLKGKVTKMWSRDKAKKAFEDRGTARRQTELARLKTSLDELNNGS